MRSGHLVVLSAATTAAPSLRNTALGPRVLQATRIFHTGQPSLAPVSPLPEYGGEVHHELMPEEFFQFLYPKISASVKYIQDAIDWEKSQQALAQKRHYLIDVQRNNIAMVLKVT
uniref:ATP synthase subunit b n=1 Tax=Rhinolophus ferrumequinum TaxID=59479 RepID=A0A671DTD4_RHIFE